MQSFVVLSAILQSEMVLPSVGQIHYAETQVYDLASNAEKINYKTVAKIYGDNSR